MPRWWDGAQWTDHYGPVTVGRPPATTPDGQPLAPWWHRVGAYVIDAFIVGPLSLLASLPFLVPVFRGFIDEIDRIQRETEAGRDPGTFNPMWSDDLALYLVAIGLVGLTVSMVYEVGFLRWKQATPGKLAVGLRVRLRERPGQLPWGTIFLRWLVKNAGSMLGLIPLVGGFLGLAWWINFLWPLWDDKSQALHDKAAATNVVKVR